MLRPCLSLWAIVSDSRRIWKCSGGESILSEMLSITTPFFPGRAVNGPKCSPAGKCTVQATFVKVSGPKSLCQCVSGAVVPTPNVRAKMAKTAKGCYSRRLYRGTWPLNSPRMVTPAAASYTVAHPQLFSPARCFEPKPMRRCCSAMSPNDCTAGDVATAVSTFEP